KKYGYFTSIGELNIEFENHTEKATNYCRELDLQNSLGKVNYRVGETTFKREYFCSYPNRMMGMKFNADKTEAISFKLSMNIIQDSSFVEIDENTYRLDGFINGNNRPFHVLVHVKNDGGNVMGEGDKLVVEDANSVEIFLTIATDYKMEYPNYRGENPRKITDRIMSESVLLGYEKLKEIHINDYRELYDRVNLEIQGNDKVEKLPTNERFEKLKKGESDPGYKVLAFNLGRYMVISSSRPGTLPANLQGVWNNFRVAPWSGNYQSNVNVQEIYWSCGNTNLLECQQAYIDWIENLVHSGKEVANRIYGTNGWISHTVGNIWGHAGLIGNHPWGMYSMGSVWHCQHVWDQFAFNQDLNYLKNQAYPILKEASVFWLENMVSFEGYLITAPTVSAEHGALQTEEGLNPAFHDFRSDKYVYSLPGVYQDMEMLWDLFTNTSETAKLVGEKEFADSLINVREKLLPLKIGKHGQLQ
ncbi:MAG: glycoside hydrolase N-terminal domain-containing protein, partial [Draconibacterium sp.]|nr:glycoside hydrolase N-terminal domain-containing protein [Draconibacterium sp.]